MFLFIFVHAESDKIQLQQAIIHLYMVLPNVLQFSLSKISTTT